MPKQDKSLRMKRFVFISCLLSLVLTVTAATTAEKADSAYNSEDYRRAIELYNQSINEDGVSADIYYNLGNAYYRNDNNGKAILNYERALRLDPSHSDARTNLNYVKSKIADKPEDDTNVLLKMHSGIMSAMSANAWAYLAFGVFILLLGAVGLYIFAGRITYRKIGFFGGVTLFFVCAYLVFMACDAAAFARSHESAVVTVPSTQLTSAPRGAKSGKDKVVTIHEGTRVEIIDSVATPDDPVSPKWYNIKLNNSTKAWVRASDVERI